MTPPIYRVSIMTMRVWIQAFLAVVLSWGSSTGAEQPGKPFSAEALGRIDAHAHLLKDAPALYQLFDRLNVRILNICVVDKYERGSEEAEPQHAMALKVFHNSKGRGAWCSTFDPQNWETPGFAQRAVTQLEQTFQQGAIAVKIYKSIGMELKSKAGKYLMPDDPVFDPIFQAIAARNKTLFAHIAEPIAAWLPLDPTSPDYGYYSTRAAWHMFGHPERPSKETILAARDRMLKRHPKLRVVGCHLGSMEEDVNDIARRLEQYPNFAVDTAARMEHLALQNRDKVRAFLIKYQDRVLYATDLVTNDWDDATRAAKKWESEYARDWKYLTTEETVDFGGRKIQGLALPEGVLRKLYRENALKWVPGILEASGEQR
jgi:predicted TIM-barrel fold metal-dependent hydrolase